MKPDPQIFDYGIVGGGAAGTILAIRLLQAAPAGTRIAMVEAGEPGRGVAYGSDDPSHLLNVPAGGMSVFGERPEDFVDFLRLRDGHATPVAFVPRRDYAAYLAQRLGEARVASAAEFVHVQAHASRIEPGDGRVDVVLDDGARIVARRVALAPGNRARDCPFKADGMRRVRSAWDAAGLLDIGRDDAVVIAGTGLSMVDVVLGLEARGHRGPVTVVSRHGLMPLPHAAEKHPLDFDIDAFASLGLRQRLHLLRATARRMQAAGLPWQSLMDALRHHVRRLWQSLSADDQRRFLRHAVRHWDVHRHRIPVQVAERLQALQGSGGLVLMAGRIWKAGESDDGIDIQLEGRGGNVQRLHAQWLVNATGIETRAAHYPNPLLRAMLANGHACPGPHGLGIDTDAEATVTDAAGTPQPRIAAIGSLRLGSLWETTAVPDLRDDALALATRWSLADAAQGGA